MTPGAQGNSRHEKFSRVRKGVDLSGSYQKRAYRTFQSQEAARESCGEATAILRRQTAQQDVQFQVFELYTLRHTCLTRWAPHMDPWTLAYLAGHRDMHITGRYVHPQEQMVRAAMDRAQVTNSGHTSRHTGQAVNLEQTALTTPTIRQDAG